MALGSTQPLTEMSTRSISWGWRRPVRKADNLPPSCAIVTKSGNLNFLEPSGPLQACNGTDLPLNIHQGVCYGTTQAKSFVVIRSDCKNCALLCCYAASSDDFRLTTFRSCLQGSVIKKSSCGSYTVTCNSSNVLIIHFMNSFFQWQHLLNT